MGHARVFRAGAWFHPAWRTKLLYDFLWEALQLITFWVVVIGCLRLLERILGPYIKHRAEQKRQQEERLAASIDHRNHLEEMTRAALLAKTNSISNDILANIQLLAKSKRVNMHELERMVYDQFGVGIRELDDEDGQSVISQLEAMKPR